jgi:hypothetical protein
MVGELYIGGTGLARGYLNRAELTRERFLADPFVTEPEARIYRTGDVARYLADGNIEYLGRNDFQVKIRGFRIELGEIEARLCELSGVRDAVVIAREDSPGETRLVAYYTVSRMVEFHADQFRAHLSSVLPEYMVPTAYVRLECLPMTPSRKVDRRVLPSPEMNAFSARGYEAPIGETEKALAGIWVEVLKVERVGRHDNFFELGGHSLLVVRMVTRMRQTLDLEVGIRDIFEHPELANLSRALESKARTRLLPVARIKRVQRSASIPEGAIIATGSNGHRIASRDNGSTWYDLRTGKVIG